MEPVVLQAQAQGFEEGWLAALQAMAVPEDSQLWNHEQIPRPTLTNPVQSQADVDDDEDTPSFRKPMKAIDTYVENLDLEVTSNLNAPGHEETQQPPIEDAPGQLVDDEAAFFPTNPSA